MDKFTISIKVSLTSSDNQTDMKPYTKIKLNLFLFLCHHFAVAADMLCCNTDKTLTILTCHYYIIMYRYNIHFILTFCSLRLYITYWESFRTTED